MFADFLEDRAGMVDCERCGPPRMFPPYQWVCPTCDGTGRVSNGHAEMGAALRATAEKVPRRFDGPLWGWNRLPLRSLARSGIDLDNRYASVADDVFRKLSVDKIPYTRAGPEYWRDYPTAAAAIRDLCEAYIKVTYGEVGE